MSYIRRQSGFTLMEVIVVISITIVIATFSIYAIFYLKSNSSYEREVAERAINDAIVGYYSVLGVYPNNTISEVVPKAEERKMTSEQVTYVVEELKKYSGYVYVPNELLTRYDFYLYYPNNYVFKIRTEEKLKLN